MTERHGPDSECSSPPTAFQLLTARSTLLRLLRALGGPLFFLTVLLLIRLVEVITGRSW